jgi:hypothetical protein
MADASINQQPDSRFLRRHSRMGIVACGLLLLSGVLVALVPAVASLMESVNRPQYHDDPKAFENSLLGFLCMGLAWLPYIPGLILTIASLVQCLVTRSRPRRLFPLLAVPLLLLNWVLISVLWP